MNGDAMQLQYHQLTGQSGETRRIAFIKASGVSPGVFWLPGLNSDMASTKASVLAAWAAQKGRACLRFDYSGHGRSSGTLIGGTISDWLEEAGAVLAAHAEGPVVAVGSSMGGWIALLLARRLVAAGQGGRLAGLVLIAPAWDMTEALMWQRFPQDVRQEIETAGVFMRPSAYSEDAYPVTRALIEDGRRHLIGAAGFDPGCPVRIIHGMADEDVPWQHGLRLLEVLTGADMHFTMVKDAGHRLSREGDLALLMATIEGLLPPEQPASPDAAR